MVSRISNEEVRRRTQQRPLTQVLLGQQLLLCGKAARAPAGDPLRDAVFCPGSLRPATERFVRKVGRPRQEWASQLWRTAVRMCGDVLQFEATIADEAQWNQTVSA